MSKTEKLNELFERWRAEQANEPEESLKRTKIASKNITKEHFCEDGIICEEAYEKETPKVLFIAKEPNIASEETEAVSTQIDAFLDYFETGVDDWRGRLRCNVCKYYSWMITNAEKANRINGLLNGFAFMNLNKRGGDTAANDKMIAEYCKVYKNYILKEIEIIDPDRIVWLGFKTFDEIVCSDEKIFDFEKRISDDGTTNYFLNVSGKNIPVIKAYHPSFYFASDNKKKQVLLDNSEE